MQVYNRLSVLPYTYGMAANRVSETRIDACISLSDADMKLSSASKCKATVVAHLYF